MCHGKGGMGTGLLARRTDRPLLEERNDLTVDYVIQAARTASATCPHPQRRSQRRGYQADRGLPHHSKGAGWAMTDLSRRTFMAAAAAVPLLGACRVHAATAARIALYDPTLAAGASLPAARANWA
jgi:hypothetical protein